MRTSAAGPRHAADPAGTTVGAERGWYLYGITRRGLPVALLEEADAAPPDGDGPMVEPDAPLQLLDCSGLAAVVRPVLLADFSQAVLEQRLRSETELEALVRSHNRVIESVHARQAILPARFGMVYASADDVVATLRSAHDALVFQLDRLEGCDEWAVHLYADRAVVRQRIAASDPAIRRLSDERAAATPGRGWFLEQQLRGELEAVTDQALATLTQGALDRLSGCAAAGQVNRLGPAGSAREEVEILRASFLVSRDGAERFKEELRSSAGIIEGLRCEYSGPWPPYSFASRNDEAAG